MSKQEDKCRSRKIRARQGHCWNAVTSTPGSLKTFPLPSAVFSANLTSYKQARMLGPSTRSADRVPRYADRDPARWPMLFRFCRVIRFVPYRQFLVAAFVLGSSAVMPGAAELPRSRSDVPIENASTPPECTCRAAGQSFSLGSKICIGNRVMRCTMAINVTSWEQTEEPCPQS